MAPNDTSITPIRTRILATYGFVFLLTVAAWGLAFALFWDFPASLALCLPAYACGLRHAVDADHIAAIDNVTRKLMEAGQRPVGVGLFFALGHSTVVALLALTVALSTDFLGVHFPQIKEIGALVGLTVSAIFLIIIAITNLTILIGLVRSYRKVQAGEELHEDALKNVNQGRGLLARITRPFFRLVNQSWQMFPVGFLFGLGFDTASEIALLGIAATQAAQQVPVMSIMVFPLLFMAGMTLVDATDGILVLGTYGWAYVEPKRKLIYNIAITLVSLLIALGVGTIEALSILSSRLDLEGGFWSLVNLFGEYSGAVGYTIITLLILLWAGSYLALRASSSRILTPNATERAG
ncbi:MAG: HoxN/HupN/NixA family nickel/cobalt transporter [Gemmataceae bacterium]|nr:HoxN/HupN/NixA family nickel/cobalt transporter [Gemmataceae bacterium]